MLTSQEGRRTLKGSVWVSLADGLVLPTGLIISIVLSRRLGPDGYGQVLLVLGVILQIEWAITSVLSRPTIKYISDSDNWHPVGTTVLRAHLYLSMVAALIVATLAGPIAHAINAPHIAPLLRLMALDIPLFCLAQAHRNILMGIGGYQKYAAISAARWIVRAVLVTGLVLAGFSVAGALLGNIGASLIELIIARSQIQPSLWNRAAHPLRSMLDFIAPLLIFTFCVRFYTGIDLFALKALGGSVDDAGIYGTARAVTLAVSTFGFAIAPVLLANLSRMERTGKHDQARRIAWEAVRLILGTFPFAGLIAGSAVHMITLVYGPAFVAGAEPLPFLLFSALLQVIMANSAMTLVAAGNPSLPMKIAAPLVPLTMILHLLITPLYGMVGAAAVTLLVSLLGAIGMLLAQHTRWGGFNLAGTMLRCAIGTAAAWAFTAMMVDRVQLLAALAVIVPAIPFLYLLSGEFSAEERRMIKSLFSRFSFQNRA